MGNIKYLVVSLSLFLVGCASSVTLDEGQNIATTIRYINPERVSTKANKVCNVESNIRKNILEYAENYSVPIYIVETDEDNIEDSSNDLDLEVRINEVISGKFSSPRLFVASRIHFTVVLKDNGKQIGVESKACESSHGGFMGLGFSACGRFDKVTQCVGKFTAKWLTKVL